MVEGAAVDALTRTILRMFGEMQKDTLDLHSLFEAGGNDPDLRERVFDRVEALVRKGLLEERGNDFYALSAKGREALQKEQRNAHPAAVDKPAR